MKKLFNLFKKTAETKYEVTYKWIDEAETTTEIVCAMQVVNFNADPCIEVISVKSL